MSFFRIGNYLINRALVEAVSVGTLLPRISIYHNSNVTIYISHYQGAEFKSFEDAEMCFRKIQEALEDSSIKEI